MKKVIEMREITKRAIEENVRKMADQVNQKVEKILIDIEKAASEGSYKINVGGGNFTNDLEKLTVVAKLRNMGFNVNIPSHQFLTTTGSMRTEYITISWEE